MWQDIGSAIAAEFSDLPSLSELVSLSVRLLLAALAGLSLSLLSSPLFAASCPAPLPESTLRQLDPAEELSP